jgi:high-affinity nickel-transport protein
MDQRAGFIHTRIAMIPVHAAPLGLALLGLVLGMRHATDPDHVVAVTAILSRQPRVSVATRVGLLWGLGHTVTVIAVGLAIIVFRVAIPVRVGLAMELAVAVVLILLGLSAATGLLRRTLGRATFGSRADGVTVHSHRHSHGSVSHWHPHAHAVERADAADHDHSVSAGTPSALASRRPLLKSFAVGFVHGLAGSAAIALMVVSAIPDPRWAAAYLAVFCCGTIIGMALLTTAIGAPFALASSRMARMHSALVIGSGLLSFGFGIFIAWQIVVVGNLFGASPSWTPR